MDEQQFLARIAHLNHGAAGDSDAFDADSLDSVDLLDVIAAIDETYSVVVPIEKLKACQTVGDLRALIRTEASA
jgi:acyl carrier protein